MALHSVPRIFLESLDCYQCFWVLLFAMMLVLLVAG